MCQATQQIDKPAIAQVTLTGMAMIQPPVILYALARKMKSVVGSSNAII
jgi:hypothetical protein